VDFYNRWGKIQADSCGNLAAAFSKLEGYAARLALIHHIVTRVSAGLSETVEMEADSIRAGIGLAQWFAAEAERIYSILAEDESQTEIRRLIELIRNRGGSITARELQRSNSRKYPNSDAAEAALNDLVTPGFGAWQTMQTGGRGGHPVNRFFLCSTHDTSDTRPDDEPDADPSAHDTCAGHPVILNENGQVSEVSCVGQGEIPESSKAVAEPPGEQASCSSEIDFTLI
jgi:hypothetical protein